MWPHPYVVQKTFFNMFTYLEKAFYGIEARLICREKQNVNSRDLDVQEAKDWAC